MLPAFIGKNVQRWIKEDKFSLEIKKYGDTNEKIFITLETLKAKYDKDFKKLPVAAMAMYTFADRLKRGLRQLMGGARKFVVKYIDRNDIISLTKECADVTGIPYVMELDMK